VLGERIQESPTEDPCSVCGLPFARYFLKPFGIMELQKLPRDWGVVADDFAVAVLAARVFVSHSEASIPFSSQFFEMHTRKNQNSPREGEGRSLDNADVREISDLLNKHLHERPST